MNPYDEEDLVPERLLADLAAAPLVPEDEIELYTRTHGTAELSPAELLALRYISHGLTSYEIAVATCHAPETIKTQLKTARYKLRAKTSAQAACEAIRLGLIP